MSKHCEHCGKSYSDEMESCPHCTAAVEVVEEVEPEVIFFDEEPVPATEEEPILLAEAEPERVEATESGEDSAINLNELGALDSEAVNSSMMIHVARPDELAEAAPVLSDPDSAINLTHPAVPLDFDAELPVANAELSTDAPADEAWASLVAEAEDQSHTHAAQEVVHDNLAEVPTAEHEVIDFSGVAEGATRTLGETSAIDLGSLEAEPTPAVSDLNLVHDAMEPGTSQVYMGGRHEADEEEAVMEVEECDEELVQLTETRGAAEAPRSGERVPAEEEPPSARDIVEEVESGVDLTGRDGGVEDVEETAAREEAAAGDEDSAVDLGGPSSPEITIEQASSALEFSAGHAPGKKPAASRSAGFDEALSEEGGELAQTEEQVPLEEGGEETTAEAPEDGDGEAPVASAKPRGRAGAWVGGALLGAALTSAAAVGLWFAGLLPEKTPAHPQINPQGGQAAVVPPTLDLARTRLVTGEVSKALETFGQIDQQPGNAENPEFLAARGETLWLAALQQLAQENKPIDKAELARIDKVAKAREDLAKANNAEGAFWLGQIQEMTDGPDAARATYQKGIQSFPQEKQRFQSAIDRLDLQATEKPAGASGAMRRTPPSSREAYWVAVALIALQAQPAGGDQPMPPVAGQPATADNAEAGGAFWAAVKLAQDNKYTEAVASLDQARTLHDKLRFARLRKAQNPLTDPTEQIFLRACDELRVFWQVRDRLGKAGYLDVARRASPPEVLKSLDRLAEEKKVLVALASKLKEEKYDTKDLGKALDQLLADKGKADMDGKTAAKKVADVAAALKAAGIMDPDPVKAVADLQNVRLTSEKKLAEVALALKAAGVTASDGAKAVADLVAGKKASEKKVADLLAALKAAGVTDTDPLKAVGQAVAARDAAQATLEGLKTKLVGRNYLPATATRNDVSQGVDRALGDVDHPIVVALGRLASDFSGMGGKVGQALVQGMDTRAQLAASRLTVGRLELQLTERWTPEQMLDVWLVVLKDGSHKAMTAQALQDVQRVNSTRPMPAAECVKGLAARSQGQYDEARSALKNAVRVPAVTPDAPWRRAAVAALTELTDPRAHYIPKVAQLETEEKWTEALATADEALKVFPKEGFPKEHASLLALRGLVQLGMTEGKGKPSQEVVKALQQEAAEALAGGETVEAAYVQGRLAEAQGNLAEAEKSYRAALKAYEAARPDARATAAFVKAHPVSDPAGSRYRVALTRVLLGQVRHAKEAPPQEAPKPGGTKTTRKDTAGETIAVAGTTTVTPPSAFVVWCGGCEQMYQLPPLALAQGRAPVAVEESAEAPDPRLQEALELSDKLIAAGDYHGYLLKGETLARMGKWMDGLHAVATGARQGLPADEGARLGFVLDNHPAFQRRDGIKPPDPVVAEEHYSDGLRHYFDNRFVEAEKNFGNAVYYDDQDARYLYFLGLSRLAQPGKRDVALEDFRQAGRLEQKKKPGSDAVSAALERVQGPTRRLLNGVRAKAIEEATSKP